jgi:hypothetical protein
VELTSEQLRVLMERFNCWMEKQFPDTEFDASAKEDYWQAFAAGYSCQV